MAARMVLRVTELANGELRPYVPVVLAFSCGQCGGQRHYIENVALADTGTSRMIYPADQMFADHGPTWDSLEYAGKAYHHSSGREWEMRLWPVDVTVYGVPITGAVWVSEPGSQPKYAVAGRTDLFARFTVTFLYHMTPPLFTLEPAGGGWSSEPRHQPIPYGDLERVYHLDKPTSTTLPALTASADALQLGVGRPDIERAGAERQSASARGLDTIRPKRKRPR